MTLHLGYRFRLKPTQVETIILRRFLGCSRFVWNEVLALNELRRQRGEKRLSYSQACAYLIYLKDEYTFLREAHSQPLQQTLKDLEQAYRNADNPNSRVRSPLFKKLGQPFAIRFPQAFRINGNSIYLPKIGWIGFRKSRKVEGRAKHVTLSFDGLDWYVAINTEREVDQPTHVSRTAVGIDLGIARFAALSDGTFVDGVNAFKKHDKRLRFLQRRMSRKRHFSANWRKARAKVLLLHRKIANVRYDMLHKASTTISKNHAIVVMEDLRIVDMTATTRATLDRAGVNAHAKRHLNRRILDQGWGEFRRQIAYKLAWNGGSLHLVDPRETSRTCAACEHVSSENRRTQAMFECVACGHTSNADTNAAINILRRAGQARIACGDSPFGDSTKQETRRIV